MDQDDPIFVPNGHHLDKLQIIIISNDRSHHCDDFRQKIVPIGQHFIRFRSLQSFIMKSFVPKGLGGMREA